MRIIAGRERPHPGAQLDLFETADGYRYTAFATTTPAGQLGWLDARHRTHACVEDRIRCGKDTGLGRFPSRQFAVNQAWLLCALTALNLLAWTQTMLLTDQTALAVAEPKTVRYRLLRIDHSWQHAPALVTAFQRIAPTSISTTLSLCRAMPMPASKITLSRVCPVGWRSSELSRAGPEEGGRSRRRLCVPYPPRALARRSRAWVRASAEAWTY
jgi:hypothetical protein